MFWDLVILLVVAVYSAILASGVVVFRANSTSVVHKLVFIFSILFTAWLTANFLAIWLPHKELGELFFYADYLITALFLPSLLLFTMSFPIREKKLTKQMIIAVHVPAAILALLVFFNQIIFGVEKAGYYIAHGLGPFFGAYWFVVALYLLFSFAAVIRNFLQHTGIKKDQAKIVLYGFISVLCILLVANLFWHKYVTPEIFVLINLSLSLLPLGMTTALLKYRFMGVKTTYHTYSIFLTLFFLTVLFLSIATSYGTDWADQLQVMPMVIYAGLSVLFVPVFVFIERTVKNIVEQVFSSHIDLQNLFNEFVTEIEHKKKRAEKIHVLIEKIELVLGVEPTIVLINDNNTCEHHGRPLIASEEALTSTLCGKCNMFKKIITRKDLKLSSFVAGGEKENLYKILKSQKMELVIPIMDSSDNVQKLWGIVMLPKRRHTHYSREEITFLGMLTPQLALYFSKEGKKK